MLKFLQALWLSLAALRHDEDDQSRVRASDLKRLLKISKSHSFANSCMLPSMRIISGQEVAGTSYWLDHPVKANLDCCIIHRSLKQTLIEMQTASLQKMMMKQAAIEGFSARNYSEALVDPRSFASASADVEQPAKTISSQDRYKLYGNQPRQLTPGSADGLRFHLRLIERRLVLMMERKQATPQLLAPKRLVGMTRPKSVPNYPTNRSLAS